MSVIESARGASAFTDFDHLLSGQSQTSLIHKPPQEATPRRTWDDLIDDLLKLFELKDDWDGQGAAAPDRAIVSAALTLASSLKTAKSFPATRAIAGTGGTVYLEWQTPVSYTEIEVVSPAEVEVRQMSQSSASEGDA